MTNARNTVTNIENAKDFADKIERLLAEYEEKILLEAVKKYDFFVGSKKVEHELINALPEGAVRDAATVIYSPHFIKDPGKVYAIKKFDMTEFLSSCRAESEEK